jgi:predicted metal-dependent enzyme (double-stranded beta helix superfamily)
MASIAPLREFVQAVTRCVEQTNDEAVLLESIGPLLQSLIADDLWLPAFCAQAHPQFYRQYLLHCDPLERFSVVSFVWGIGQKTPIHDHRVWGLVGVLRGAELCQAYAPDNRAAMHPVGAPHRLERGQIEAVSPRLGDVHTVANAMPDQPSISIHVYGANIGAVRRHVYLPASDSQNEVGSLRKDFVSGYSAAWLPNLWDRTG